MRRAPLVIAGTAAGLAGVLAYHPSSARSLHALTGVVNGTTSASTTHRAGVFGAPASQRASATTSSQQPSAKSGSQQSSAATGSQQPSAAAAPANQSRSATGADVSYQYGDLQLKVTMSGTRISDVSVAQLDVADPRSASIDTYAVPQLRLQALAAQSAQIDGVSGASYTSQAYRQSLQSALDQLAAASRAK